MKVKEFSVLPFYFELNRYFSLVDVWDGPFPEKPVHHSNKFGTKKTQKNPKWIISVADQWK